MRLLVRRYVTAEQRKSEEFGITEDDVMEIRQDISSMRFEMIDIFKRNGYKTPSKEHDANVGKNNRFPGVAISIGVVTGEERGTGNVRPPPQSRGKTYLIKFFNILK